MKKGTRTLLILLIVFGSIYFFRENEVKTIQKAKEYISSYMTPVQQLVYNTNYFSPEEPPPHCDIGYVLIGKERDESKDLYLNRSWLQRTCPNSVARVYLSETDMNDVTSCQADLRCCSLSKVYSNLRGLVDDRSWYVVANDDTFVIPDNIARFVATLKQDDQFLIGGDAYTALNEGEYLLPRRLPYGALENIRLEKNIRVLSEHSGYVISQKLAQQMEDRGRFLAACEQYNLANITLAMVAKDLGAKLVRHQGFNPSHPFESFMFEENYLHTLPLTFNMAGKEDWMPLLRFLINEKSYVPGYNGKIQTEILPEDWNGCLDCIGLQQTMLADYYSRYIGGKAKVAIVGVPDTSDPSENLIYMGEKMLMERLDIEIVHVCLLNQPCDTKEMARKLGSPKVGFIMLHGANLVGDTKVDDLRLREQVVHDMSTYSILTFPHTLRYSSNQAASKSREVFQQHPDLLLITRDPDSFAFAKKQFKSNSVKVGDLPDVTFMIGNQVQRRKKQTPIYDIFFHSGSQEEDASQLQKQFTSMMQKMSHSDGGRELTFGFDDWQPQPSQKENQEIAQLSTPDERALARTLEAIRFVSQGKVVITNQLHSHMALVLAGIPHVLLDHPQGPLHNYFFGYSDTCSMAAAATTMDEAITKALALHKKFYSPPPIE